MTGDALLWVRPMLDVAVIAALAAVVWRLGDPARTWEGRERRLEELFGRLQALAGEERDLAERLGRDFERQTAALLGTLTEARASAEAARARREPAATPGGGGTQPASGRDPASQRSAAARESTGRPAAREAHAADDGAALQARVARLAASATPVEEIARRLDLPLAEARLLVGMQAARAAARARGGKNGAAESAG